MSIFNEFPYTNFHELNLDWILQEIKKIEEGGSGVEDSIEELKKALAALDGSFKDYYSNEEAWHVIQVKNGFVLSRYIVDDSVVHTQLRASTDGTVNTPMYWSVNEKTKILPVPLENAAIAGNVESYLGIVTNAVIRNKSTFARSIVLLDSSAAPDGSTRRFGINVIITGKHAEPPAAPTYDVLPKRQEAVEIADSYYRSRTVNGRNYAYGANAITYSNNNVINNDQGSAMMECDTLVALVMMGIPYNLSPYANDTAGYTFNFDNLTVNPNGLSWPLAWKYNADLKRKVTYTGGENWYYWDNGLVFKDINRAASGDIVIFRRDGGKYFDGITHTGILNMVGSTPWIYHVTGAKGVESPMMYEPLENVIKRGGYTLKDNVYFARPNYA